MIYEVTDTCRGRCLPYIHIQGQQAHLFIASIALSLVRCSRSDPRQFLCSRQAANISGERDRCAAALLLCTSAADHRQFEAAGSSCCLGSLTRPRPKDRSEKRGVIKRWIF